jgi:hypothetical protein
MVADVALVAACNHGFHGVDFRQVKAWGVVWLLFEAGLYAPFTLGSLLASLVSLRVYPHPWWGATGILAAVMGAHGIIVLAGRGVLFTPWAWVPLILAVLCIIGGGFLFSRRAVRSAPSGASGT